MNRYVVILLTLIAMVLCAAVPSQYVSATQVTKNSTFTASTKDMYVGLYIVNGSYGDVYLNSTGNFLSDGGSYLTVKHQSNNPTPPVVVIYDIMRVGIPFSTASIPDSATITAATLRLKQDDSVSFQEKPFDVVVVDGSDLNATPELADYGKLLWSTTIFAMKNTTDMPEVGDAWRDFPLNVDGRAAINVSGTTKLALRHDDDRTGSEPTDYSCMWISFHSRNSGSANAPKLIVTYTYEVNTPVVLTEPATNVTNTSATLNSYLVSNGGDPEGCDVDFEWGTSASALNETEYGCSGVATGESCGSSISGLSNNTVYFFRATAENEIDTAYGDILYFITGDGNGDESQPYDLLATPLSSTEIALTWEMPDAVDEAYILAKTGGWPTNYDDANATLVYQSDGSSTVHSGLQPGTTYYYRAWGIIDDVYSSNYAQDMATTFIGEQEDEPDIEPPPWWFQEPTCAAYEKVPGFVLLQNLAGSYDLPEPTACLLLTILLIIVASIGIHVMVHNALVTLSMAGVFTVGAAIAGLLPLWMIAITVVIGGLVAFVWSRA